MSLDEASRPSKSSPPNVYHRPELCIGYLFILLLIVAKAVIMYSKKGTVVVYDIVVVRFVVAFAMDREHSRPQARLQYAVSWWEMKLM
jgi:hypothetical protein